MSSFAAASSADSARRTYQTSASSWRSATTDFSIRLCRHHRQLPTQGRHLMDCEFNTRICAKTFINTRCYNLFTATFIIL